MQSEKLQLSKRFILLSPLITIGIGHLTAQIAGVWLGAWAWLPLTIVFWATMAFFIAQGGGREAVSRWLSRPRGSWGWLLLAVVVGFLPLAVFLMYWRLLAPPWLLLCWLLFAFVNPWLEEGY